MISYDGSDFTTASVSKKGSPVVQSTGKVIKSIFVPNVGWASQVMAGLKYSGISRGIVFVIKRLFPCQQLTSGEVWVQFNDGSQLVVQAGVSCITYTSPDGRITKYGVAFNFFFFLTSQNR